MTPVKTEQPPTCDEAWEPRTYAENQPQYTPLPAWKRVRDDHGLAVFDFELTDDEVDGLAKGGRIRLSVLTFNRPLQPVKLEVVRED